MRIKSIIKVILAFILWIIAVILFDSIEQLLIRFISNIFNTSSIIALIIIIGIRINLHFWFYLFTALVLVGHLLKDTFERNLMITFTALFFAVVIVSNIITANWLSVLFALISGATTLFVLINMEK